MATNEMVLSNNSAAKMEHNQLQAELDTLRQRFQMALDDYKRKHGNGPVHMTAYMRSLEDRANVIRVRLARLDAALPEHSPSPSKDPVGAALSHVIEVETVEARKIKNRLDLLEAQRRQALPIEHAVIEDLDKRIAKAREEYKLHTSRKDNGYKRIDLRQPLRWRNDDGLPKLAIFTPETSVMKVQRVNYDLEFPIIATFVVGIIGGIMFGVSFTDGSADVRPIPLVAFALVAAMWTIYGLLYYFGNGIKSPRKLPKVLAEPYLDVIDIGSRTRKIDIKTHFPAAQIPTEVRQEIRKAQARFGKRNIFLVAEADWTTTVKPKVNLDPLVIAIDDGVTYLITSFDLTPIEKAVAEEFTY